MPRSLRSPRCRATRTATSLMSSACAVAAVSRPSPSMQPTTSRSTRRKRGEGLARPVVGDHHRCVVVDRELQRRIHLGRVSTTPGRAPRRGVGQVAGDPEQPAGERRRGAVEVGHLLRGDHQASAAMSSGAVAESPLAAGAQPHDETPGVCSVQHSPGVGVALLSAGYQLVVRHRPLGPARIGPLVALGSAPSPAAPGAGMPGGRPRSESGPPPLPGSSSGRPTCSPRS